MLTRLTTLTTWSALTVAPLALIIGHLGPSHLAWTSNQISTYAAQAPRYPWITGAIVLSAVGTLGLGLLLPLQRQYGLTLVGRLTSMLFGVASAGLLLIAGFKETLPSHLRLATAAGAEVRQQTFHDAGLWLFFMSACAALLLAGVLELILGAQRRSRALGGSVVALSVLAPLAMTTAWYTILAVGGPAVGLRQRASFLCLWVAAVLLLWAWRGAQRAE